MSQSYRSDLTDEQWEVIQTLIPPANTKSDYQHADICGAVSLYLGKPLRI